MRSRIHVVVALSLITALGMPAAAHADPGKSPQWFTLTGECGGVPAVMTDPPGPGPTAFNLATGRVGIGFLFESVYMPTGEVVQSEGMGNALEHANQDITTCNFPVPPEFSPDGTTNWVFRVTGFFH